MFAHGSSGIGEPLKAFGRWLASFGIGFLCPNSFVLKDRITYTSPVSRDDYERIHVMRSAELANAAARLTEVPGFDGRYIVAGTSEGGVAAARFQAPQGQAECARMIFSWPCEDNYHVAAHRTAIPQDMPVLNVMSAADKFFSQANSWLDNPSALGHELWRIIPTRPLCSFREHPTRSLHFLKRSQPWKAFLSGFWNYKPVGQNKRDAFHRWKRPVGLTAEDASAVGHRRQSASEEH